MRKHEWDYRQYVWYYHYYFLLFDYHYYSVSIAEVIFQDKLGRIYIDKIQPRPASSPLTDWSWDGFMDFVYKVTFAFFSVSHVVIYQGSPSNENLTNRNMHVIYYMDSFFQHTNICCEKWWTQSTCVVMVLGGKFSPEKEPFWKELIYFSIFLFLWKHEKIWSGTSIAKGLDCVLLMTKMKVVSILY